MQIICIQQALRIEYYQTNVDCVNGKHTRAMKSNGKGKSPEEEMTVGDDISIPEKWAGKRRLITEQSEIWAEI